MLSKETFINYIDLVKELFDRIDKLSDDVSLMLYGKKYNVSLFDSDWWTTTDKIINVFFLMIDELFLWLFLTDQESS